MKQVKVALLYISFGPSSAMTLNLLMVLVTYFIVRVEFPFKNYSYFSGNLSASHLTELLYGGYIFDRSAIAYTNTLYILLMLLPLWIKKRKGYHLLCKQVFVVINVLTLIISLCDSVYSPYTLRRITTSVFSEFRNENSLVDVFWGEFVGHWYLVLLAIVVTTLLWKLYVMSRIVHTHYATATQRWEFDLVQFVLLASFTPLIIGACRGGLAPGIRPITVNNANQYVRRPTEYALVFNTPFSLIRTIEKNVFDAPTYYPNLKAAAKVFTPIHCPKPTYAFQKKNVVVLVVKSFGREYIRALDQQLENGRYKGYIPCVGQFIDQSATYGYSFCNGRKSIDGMLSVLCGIPMFKEPSVPTNASMNDYTSMAGPLAREGYHTVFFHGANRGSAGLLAFVSKVGFQAYYGRRDYATGHRFGGDADFDGYWGTWDESFLQYWCTKIGEMREPFMTVCSTVSSHTPYVIPEKYKDVYPGEGPPIHKCTRHADMAIGKFFEAAKQQPRYKNILFVPTSDHTSLSDHAQYQTDTGGLSALLIIFDPSGGVPVGIHDGIVQQIDILPTVLSLLDYDKPFLSLGCDLMTTSAVETYAVNYLDDTYRHYKYDYVLQFDGQQTRGVYTLDDPLIRHNLKGRVKEQCKMEQELKAITQQYMYRMENDQLMP